jgi:exosome complex RNA-binding protein Csl4/predicted RNA methylase
MRQRHLEMMLEKLSGFRIPDPLKEQYSTPATVAAELLHFAFMRGDITDTVYDLGCGGGILAIGAKLLGAEKVIGFDDDSYALEIARANAEKLGVKVEFECCSINDVHGKAHTVVMNPPFGAQVKGSDRPFLRKALELSSVVYSIHNAGSMEFIKKFISPAVITDYRMIDFPIKRTFRFHTKVVQKKKENIVLPGELIGTSEEFIPKKGTFEERGNIYATATGYVKTNPKERSISVEPVTNTPPKLAVGDIVIGQVTDLKESVALVEIAGIKGRGERAIVNSEGAAIHVSNVKDAYVKDLSYEFAPFDIVKGRVLDLRNMRLSTVNKELGVMKAYCGNCRTVLKRENDKLKCPNCKRTETRKMSSDYGTGII